jgi:sulfatase-like protein
MRRPAGRPWPTLARAVAAAALVVSSVAHASLVWGPKRGTYCEPPSVFYSSHHAGGPPCCPSDDGVCPGGSVCPPSGVCAGGAKCVPTVADRPNIVLMISDDQGECFYGSARECRSTETGTPIRAPLTPSLDALAAAGTVFTVAHNTASWCYPSLNSMLTGRYQKSFGGLRSQIGSRYLSIPRALRELGRTPGTVVDSFDSDARIGGYCSMQGGKFTAALGHDAGFDARINVGAHSMGRIDCSADPNGGTPRCGTDAQGAAYAPFQIDHMRDALMFMDAMVYPKPGAPAGAYTMQQFFMWYAPRIPHQPLRSPPAIGSYLFGADGQSGFFDLGALCVGGSCPPTVAAFDESNFGSVRDYYASIYLVDANVRELRRFLQATGAPHCIGAGGQSRFGDTTPQSCHGTWTTGVTPNPAANTVFLYLSDNGWQLPHSKHNFSENGYRTRLIVVDPRTPVGAPSSALVQQAAFESPALAHSTDLLPSILGFALGTTPGTQACPESDFDGTACDGRDFRAQLASNPGGPAPASLLRRSLCGHETRRPVRPSRGRYLLTGPGTVGRCVAASAPACVLDVECGAGASCLGGHCAPHGGAACGACPSGTTCIGGRCQGAPCTDDATCTKILGTPGLCVAKTTTWCANAPDVACTSASDCPACPSVNGDDVPCRRLCQPHALKFYDSGTHIDMTDLFFDPDEEQVHENGPISSFFSNPSGPYGATLQHLECCIDDWWAGDGNPGSICQGGCPAELTCNQ